MKPRKLKRTPPHIRAGRDAYKRYGPLMVGIEGWYWFEYAERAGYDIKTMLREIGLPAAECLHPRDVVDKRTRHVRPHFHPFIKIPPDVDPAQVQARLSAYLRTLEPLHGRKPGARKRPPATIKVYMVKLGSTKIDVFKAITYCYKKRRNLAPHTRLARRRNIEYPEPYRVCPKRPGKYNATPPPGPDYDPEQLAARPYTTGSYGHSNKGAEIEESERWWEEDAPDGPLRE